MYLGLVRAWLSKWPFEDIVSAYWEEVVCKPGSNPTFFVS